MDPLTALPILQYLENRIQDFGNEVEGRILLQNQKPNDAVYDTLRARIYDLETRLQAYINSQSLSALFSGPMREIVVVKKSSSSDKQGQQQIPNAGVLVDFVGGLGIASDTAPESLMTLPDGTVCVLRTFDADGKTIRNIIISGSVSADQGQYQYQVKCMTSQQSPGWDGVRAAPELPPP